MSTRVQTIADIARLAGVSKSTVSRALNDSPLIGDETKGRIRAIAEEHQFQINLPARRLRLRQTNTVAFVTYEYKSDSAVPDVFMLEIMSGICSGLHAEGYDLLVVHVSPDDVGWLGDYLDTGRVDGFILLSGMCKHRQLDALVDAQAPFVLWGGPSGSQSYCSVNGDSVAGGRLATERLLHAGRSRVAFLGGPAVEPEVQDRYRGYEAALVANGLTVDPELVGYADYSEPSAAAVMQQLLGRVPGLDGVFVNSDRMAIAAMDAVRGLGRSVPADVAVVGYDNIALAAHSEPPLTTIRQDAPLAGRLLARTLVQHLQTGAVINVSMPAELVVRESA